MKTERHEGPTPAGGTYSEAVIADDGTILEIAEYDGEGKVLMRTYASGAVEHDRFTIKPGEIEVVES